MRANYVPRLGREVSAIGLGCWQLGADWGDVADDTAAAILDAAFAEGVTFYDTADVYGDGRSERAVGEFRARHPEIFVATKMGRRANPHVPEAYTLDAFRAWTDRSRENLGMDTLDLVQLHCPPTPVYSDPATYEALETLVAEGRIARWGVSVETCDEALAARGSPVVPGHFRRDRGLIDEDEARRAQLGLLGLQRSSLGGNVRPILLGGVQSFF